ncbi:MAG: ABC transporter permease subunit [Armatimonadetes bacterium]|nr:ABC transporter permease subunit [Armatimonadota bacterium]
MTAVYRVARATFFEAWRRRFLHTILVFAVLIIGSSWSLAYLQPGAELKLLIDIGLGSIRFFGMLLAVFLGVRLIADEMEKRTIHTLLAKPVTRTQFLLGKFLGALATVWTNILLMGIAFYLVFALKAPQFRNMDPEKGPIVRMEFMYGNIAKAIGLSFLEVGSIVALSVMASTLFSWIIAAIFSFFIYFVGQMVDFFRVLAQNPERVQSVIQRFIFALLYAVLPHFEIFDVREAILKDQFLPWSTLGKIIGTGVLYMAIATLIAWLFFKNREV